MQDKLEKNVNKEPNLQREKYEESNQKGESEPLNQKKEFKEDDKDRSKSKKKRDKYLTDMDYVNSLENLLFYMKKVYKLLKIIVQADFFNKEKVEDTLISVKK